MLDALLRSGASLEVFEIDLRARDGGALDGYVGVLEDTDEPGPVHSLWRGRRSHEFVVSDEVVAAMRAAGLTGLTVEPIESAFPADQPGFEE